MDLEEAAGLVTDRANRAEDVKHCAKALSNIEQRLESLRASAAEAELALSEAEDALAAAEQAVGQIPTDQLVEVEQLLADRAAGAAPVVADAGHAAGVGVASNIGGN